MAITLQQRHLFDEAIANMFSNQLYSNSYLFYAHILGQCHVSFDDNLPAPAGVSFTRDHYTLHINPTQFGEFSLEQRLGVLKHEMLHILSKHVQRKEDRNHKVFNYATDCAINQLIDRKHLPDYAVYPDTLLPHQTLPTNLTAEQYYDLIPTNNDSDSSEGKGQLVDDHDQWEECSGDSELQDDITKKMIESAISNTQKSRGEVPNGINEWLSLVTHTREVDWRRVLKNIVGNKRVGTKRTIMRQDRRLPNFEWIKGRTKQRKFNLLVVSDVSGSVSDKSLLDLWAEVCHICDVTQTPVNLIQVDTEPSLPELLTKNTKTIARKARGGTTLYPAIDQAYKSKLDFDAVVVTTDGYLDTNDVNDFSHLNKKVIWLIERNGQVLPEMSKNNMQVFELKGN